MGSIEPRMKSSRCRARGGGSTGRAELGSARRRIAGNRASVTSNRVPLAGFQLRRYILPHILSSSSGAAFRSHSMTLFSDSVFRGN
jgi:hypothetical protein